MITITVIGHKELLSIIILLIFALILVLVSVLAISGHATSIFAVLSLNFFLVLDIFASDNWLHSLCKN